MYRCRLELVGTVISRKDAKIENPGPGHFASLREPFPVYSRHRAFYRVSQKTNFERRR